MGALQQMLLSGSGGDPFFANDVSLLHFDGADASTVFTDQKGKTWTRSGAVELDTAIVKYGSAAALFGGGRLDCTGGVDFAFGTGDFTLEFWLRNTLFGTATGPTVMDSRVGGGPALAIYQPNSTSTLVCLNNSNQITSGALNNSQWYHIAMCRASGTTRFFIDGISIGTPYADSNNYGNGASSTMRLGQNYVNGSALAGHLDDFRITKGVARYTANFTPPNAPLPDF